MIKLLLAGTPNFSVPIFEELIKNFNVVGIVSQPDKPANRGHKIEFTPTKLLAQKYNIKCFQPNKISEIKEELEALEYDYLITAAFGQYIPTSILNIAKKLNLNVHGSLLPKYRGAAPIQYALLNGDKVTGVSLMEMVKEMDAGDVFATFTYEIDEKDVASTLFNKLSSLSAQNIVQWIKDLDAGKLSRQKQNENLVTFSPKLLKEEAQLSPNLTRKEAINKIRAFEQNPGAYIVDANNKRIKIFFATENEIKNAPKIQCSDGVIYAIDYQYESKKRIKL
ncbi:methionyl-tRNA formyltransferase [Mycoplasmopsis columbina]|uniref:Methionyl-tRNA formyltransferase n=1 Tax=Mycoplasmopsis columbina SF7 TaxID=1037410 RepID=F9UJ39_9BACT|nr:methionyl-tRNA formyltransferase [Mycoplasmopsis columbina]EGV00602.1 methionyl-tRNA formyltransferase [Mycoplasmopsis columbina SF7]VEU76667.1 Methionyl-tRNA formyltransferase [Mycoplasmopsis columbina]